MFIDILRTKGNFPNAMCFGGNGPKPITVWCSNDYLGMGQHPSVVEAMEKALRDVGAGSGYMTVRLAKRVGSNGVVYANDIQQGMLDILDKRLKSDRITNVQLVLGAQDDPKLPPASIDLALLVDVYHEFSQPQAMLRGIHEALKPGGRLVLLEYKKEDPSIPIRPEHKMSVSEAKMEVEPEGFRLGRVDDGLPWQHVLIFNKR